MMLQSMFFPRRPFMLGVRTFVSTQSCSAGHNKWSKIKQRKGIEDAKKSKLYSKAAREILTAAKIGGSSSPDENSLLASAVRRAKDAGVPRENIDNALVKAERSKGQGQVLVFEAMVKGSIGLIVECRSDNINRTVGNLREILHHHGARPASVKFMFQQRGYVKVHSRGDVDDLLDGLMNECSVDFAEWNSESSDRRGVEVSCQPEALSRVVKVIQEYALSSPLCEIVATEINWVPLETREASDEEKAKVRSLVEDLEDDSDIERVFTTLDLDRLVAGC